MDFLLILVLAVLLVYFLRRYLRYRNYVMHLADSLDARQSYLYEGSTTPLTSKQTLRLSRSINALILENMELQKARASHIEQLEATLGNMQEGVVILDENNRILMANNALKNSFSSWIGEEEIVGQRLEVLFSGSSLINLIDRMKAGASNETAEIELIQSSDRRWVRVSGALMASDKTDSGDLVLLIFYEITRQKELEEIRKEFVANVSHELRTPVTIIKGYVDTLNQDYATMSEDNKLKFITKLGKNVDRMHDLLIDLLSLTKIESTTPGTNLEKIPINDFIRKLLPNYTDLLAGHKMHLELELSLADPTVHADPSKLEQVFENLLNNTTKYTHTNSTLKIGTREEEDAVILWVQDDGPGIPEADLPRIFDRFYRVEKGRSRDKGGTGLGLSIVKRIISLHGGSVQASNVEGGGLRIAMTIPGRVK